MVTKFRIACASVPELIPNFFWNPGSDGTTEADPWSQAVIHHYYYQQVLVELFSLGEGEDECEDVDMGLDIDLLAGMAAVA